MVVPSAPQIKERVKDALHSMQARSLQQLSSGRLSRFNHLMHISHQHRYVYCEIPKAGCSTVKRSLHQLETKSELPMALHDVHKRADSPLAAPMDGEDGFMQHVLGNYCFFAQVRNPYTRILSCYLDKIQPTNPEYHYYLTLLRIKAQPSFQQFLERLASRDFLLEADIHWTPQTKLLCTDRVQYDHLLKFETFPEQFTTFLQDVLQQDITPYFTEDSAHKTNAAAQLERYYTPRAIALLQQLYADDFSELGYSTDITNATA